MEVDTTAPESEGGGTWVGIGTWGRDPMRDPMRDPRIAEWSSERADCVDGVKGGTCDISSCC